MKPNIPIQHRLNIPSAPWELAQKQFGCELRVAIPGIVIAFDAARQVVSVQPAVKESIRVDGVPTIAELPILDDVPISLPRGGGYALTLPIAPGDECLLVFSDMAFDHWWESGGVQKQPDGKLYRHDIGDAIAVFGPWSQQRLIPDYATASAQLRSDDGSVTIDLSSGQITITAPAVAITSGTGTPQALMTKDFLDFFAASIMPFLASKGYAGPGVPLTSATTVLESE